MKFQSINFQNLELLSTKNTTINLFQFMTFNQFPKCGTPIHKKQNLNLKFGTPIQKERNGQLVPIHDIQSISKIWDSYPQKTKFELERSSIWWNMVDLKG